ncbi:uncharacterized protein LOC108671973 [Hyalella azteca]|uniref:Uncharacterized protein LOC108671973 n=1 Tax=Hyalella azteca TaxID=294128 RepID=A0A8B7NN17_HYAAZ|nr:uncharacterized protein LOC108671973 [Hyalella azteca]
MKIRTGDPTRITRQTSRWVFTYNNYDPLLNYVEHFSSPEFKVKRAVWGFEKSVSGTPHLQGYVEFIRSHRLSFTQRILPEAHWECASSPPYFNYLYCTKNGNFETVGDWESLTSLPKKTNRTKLASVGMVVAGLLGKHAPIVRVSKEFSLRSRYYEETARYVKKIRTQHDFFMAWKHSKLCRWQYQCFMKLVDQTQRQILWVYDGAGNAGKTWFANYLNILYAYDLLDGLIGTRDVCALLSDAPTGVCFDCSRASKDHFDYDVLEAVKNGYIVSGKYNGSIKRFHPCPVVVFSNSLPATEQLSQDRWDIVYLGEGDFTNLDKSPIYSTADLRPFVPPPKIPRLGENFNLRQYLLRSLHNSEVTSTFTLWGVNATLATQKNSDDSSSSCCESYSSVP